MGLGLVLDRDLSNSVWSHGFLPSKFPTVMASTKNSLSRWAIDLLYSSPKTAQKKQHPLPVLFPKSISRRSALLFSCVVPLTLIPVSPPSTARGSRGRKTIPLEDYITTSDGLKFYDLEEGKGPVAEKGSKVQVHFDCVYRGITAISSRESKLLAGNRAIAQTIHEGQEIHIRAPTLMGETVVSFCLPNFHCSFLNVGLQPCLLPSHNSLSSSSSKPCPHYVGAYEFTVGAPPGKERKREFVDNANGLFSAQASPKPPAAMYKITEGMKVGGRRTVLVPPEAGYGQKGMNEIPPGATFELNIELLQVVPTSAK